MGKVVLHDRERDMGKELQKPPGNYEKRNLEEKSQNAEDGGALEGKRHGSLMALVGC